MLDPALQSRISGPGLLITGIKILAVGTCEHAFLLCTFSYGTIAAIRGAFPGLCLAAVAGLRISRVRTQFLAVDAAERDPVEIYADS